MSDEEKMKIAVVTDDEENVSQHFGRAMYYEIFTVEGGKIVSKELRDKAGHRTFAQMEHLGTSDVHGYEPHSRGKHEKMVQTIEDCGVLIAGGMGYGAYEFFTSKNINVIATDVQRVEDAVDRYIRGELRDLRERLD